MIVKLVAHGTAYDPARRPRHGVRPSSCLPTVSRFAGDNQDDIAGLLLGFDIAGCVDHLIQGVAPIDDRSVLAGLDESTEKDDVLLRVPRHREQDFAASAQDGDQRQERVLGQRPEVG